MYDFIIVGAGFAGSVIAERIASQLNKKVLIVEKKNHIGGHCYDYYDDNGILIQKYGPHIFHTENEKVWHYISRFTEWQNYFHKVLAFVDGKKIPLPFNLNSIHEVFPLTMASQIERKLIENYGYNKKVSITKLKETREADLNLLYEFVLNNVFINYTIKQWGVTNIDELDPSVFQRVPIYISRDNRYFQDKYQGMPKHGYTKIFENILDHKNIKLLLNTDYREVMELKNNKIYFFDRLFSGKVIFTGKIDELFNYEFGHLPYRSLLFKYETINRSHFQEVAVVNYPNNFDYTRITDFKHFMGKDSDKTTIAREYSIEYHHEIPGRDTPFYIIPNKENFDLYEKYNSKAKQINNLYLIGRLANYTYYNMDEVVARSLKLFGDEFSNL